MRQLPMRHIPGLPFNRPATSTLLLCGLALGATMLGGCREGDDATRSIQASVHSSSLLTPSSESLTAQEQAEATYEQILRDPGLKSSTTDARRPAVAVVLASAERGASTGDVRRLVRLETRSLQHMVLIRAELNGWSLLHAQASAVESYDNRDILADLDRLQDDVQEQLEAAQDRLANYNTTLDGYRTRLDRLNGRAQEERAEAGVIFLRLPNVEPEERIRQSIEAEEHVRTAASFERDADEVMLLIEQLNPRIAEVNVRIDEFNSQLARLDDARTASNQRVRTKQRNALEARADADEDAARVDALVTELIALRDGPVAEARDEAVSKLEAAVRTARQAPRGMSLSASATQALAHLNASIARGLAAEAELFDMLATMTPALPNASQYASRAAELNQAADAAIQSAGEGFRDAASAYGSVRLSGDDADRLEDHQRELERLSAMLLGEPMIDDAIDDTGDANDDTDEDGFDG
jgi:predicted  nucleic acid-binding Zn-ribbon protein